MNEIKFAIASGEIHNYQVVVISNVCIVTSAGMEVARIKIEGLTKFCQDATSLALGYSIENGYEFIHIYDAVTYEGYSLDISILDHGSTWGKIPDTAEAEPLLMVPKVKDPIL